MPTVDLLILARDAAPHLEAAVAAVEAQQVPLASLHIADLGSTDATAHLAAELCAARPHASLTLLQPGEGALALGRMLARCQSELVAFLDADDLFLPGKLQAQLQVLQQHPAVAGVATHVVALDAQGRPMPTPAAGCRANAVLGRKEQLGRLLCDVEALAFSSVVVRRAALTQAGPFDLKLTHHFAHDMWMRLHQSRAFELLALPLTGYRMLPQRRATASLAACGEAWSVLGEQAAGLLRRFPSLTIYVDALYEALIFYAYRAQNFTAAEKYLRAKKDRSSLNARDSLMLVNCMMQQQNFPEANSVLTQLQAFEPQFDPHEKACFREMVWRNCGAGHMLVDPFEASLGMGVPNGRFVLRRQQVPPLPAA